MSNIDNELHLFHFDDYGGSPSLYSALHSATPLDLTPATMASHDHPLTSEESSEQVEEVVGKGKGITKPMPIRASTAAVHDLFDVTHSGADLPSTSQDSHQSLFLSQLPSSSFKPYYLFFDDNPQDFYPDTENISSTSESQCDQWKGKGKGKGKELPPILPPLVLSPTMFECGQVFSPSLALMSSSPGPSSYGSNYGVSATRSITDNEPAFRDPKVGSPEPQTILSRPLSPSDIGRPIIKHIPSRSRSLSNLSIYSTRSLAARSMSRIKLRFSRPNTPSNLTRKLLFKKRVDTRDDPSPSFTTVNRMLTVDQADAGMNSCPSQWRADVKVDELDSTISRLSCLRLPDADHASSDAFFCQPSPLKHKGRSNSSPLPLSALDYIPVNTTDVFAPIHIAIRNYFDEFLPQELRIQVLASLVALHEADHLRAIKEGRWTVAKASSSRNKWVGKFKGIRELVSLSRVSKSWQMLAFDGQLWIDLNLRSFPSMPQSLLLRLTAASGPFTTILDVAGHVHLTAATLLRMTNNLCLTSLPESASLPYTQLTAVNLQSCPSLTTRSLHHLLVRSPSLQKLCLKGLRAVTNTTCDILSAYNPLLISLDASRCSNIDAEGIQSLAAAAISRGEHLQLRELRLCGLKKIDDQMMTTLGKAAPYLEVLDLSYARQLHNTALDAFVACEARAEALGVETIWLSARDLGRYSGDVTKLRRRVTRLRHLSVSSCILLTDDACSNLAYSVPQLEFLEMAGIGSDLKDGGLIRLLTTTPFIRRLDLEDAPELSDALLATITPVADRPLHQCAESQPGHALEQLNISYAAQVSDDALLDLIRRCPRLVCLEVDNTRVGGAVLAEFVRLKRKRKTVDAKIVVVDCRNISAGLVQDLSGSTRPRKGWRAHAARKLLFLDAKDGNMDELKVGQDECDEKRVVLKSFYSWQTVDAVKAVRERKRKSMRRGANESMSDIEEGGGVSGKSMRWWSPGGRRAPRSGSNSPPNMMDISNDGCTVM